MQSGPRTAGQPPPVKIYNAVYSSVQVYECMVRGIAVMRRRTDSFVNATQILKVAGIDKGRRTKILEKEILPGRHEIVQGGYGKYQGTWIPLDRGRELAVQYGVAPLLAPLFDFTPNPNALGPLPGALGAAPSRPLSAASSFSSMQAGGGMPSNLAPPPILPGSALRLLNQGRAQGLFTPSTSALLAAGRHPAQAGGQFSPSYPQSPSPLLPGVSPTPPPIGSQSLKRTRSDMDAHASSMPGATPQFGPGLAASPDIQMADGSRPPSTVPGDDGAPDAKRARKEPSPTHSQGSLQRTHSQTQAMLQGAAPGSRAPTPLNGGPRQPSALPARNGKQQPLPQELQNGTPEADAHAARFASKPFMPRHTDAGAPLKDGRRAAIMAAICAADDPLPVLELLREIPADQPPAAGAPLIDVDAIVDDQGHTALHLAASMARHRIVYALVAAGADVHRGNYHGETALMRACLATHNADQQSFHTLIAHLAPSVRTLDTSRKSVLHHIVALAGVKGRAIVARYYLEGVFYWIAQNQGGDFRTLVDLQDEHGDTALNIAARVGNRGLVRTLLDVGANRILPNKLGLRPADFGVEVEELGGTSRAEDILTSLRTAAPGPVQKSQDVIADMTTLIQGLSGEFASEIKTKQDALDVTQAHLRAATRELSEQRRQIQQWQARCAELDQAGQRMRNLDKAITDEDRFDWTGRTDLDGADARGSAGPAFRWRGQGSAMVGAGSVDISFNLDPEPPLPVADTPASLIRLRRLKMWHARTEELMNERLRTLQGANLIKEFQCKKIVSLCTGIPVDRVEEMLEDLVMAVESEHQIVDIGRVSGFMQKVRDGVI